MKMNQFIAIAAMATASWLGAGTAFAQDQAESTTKSSTTVEVESTPVTDSEATKETTVTTTEESSSSTKSKTAEPVTEAPAITSTTTTTETTTSSVDTPKAAPVATPPRSAPKSTRAPAPERRGPYMQAPRIDGTGLSTPPPDINH